MSEIIATREDHLITFTVHGTLTADDVLTTATHYYPDLPRFIIWDLTNATMAEIPKEDFKYLAARLKRYHEHQSDGKTGFVCKKDVDFGLFRMYAAFAEIEGTPVTFSVFRNIENAREWLFSDMQNSAL